MTTFTDLLVSLKDEMMARYRSPFWGTALITLTLFHWKVFVYLFWGHPGANDAITYIEATVTVSSIGFALVAATVYVILFPWIELILSKLASFGIRARNDFQIREREHEIGSRRLISEREKQIIEAELRNRADQSKLVDIKLAQDLQNTLSGENFSRWLNDIKNGAINSNLSNAIYNYLNKVDSVEGKFINPTIEEAHVKFVESISSLNSIFNDGRSVDDKAKKSELVPFAQNAQSAYQEYRQIVREELGI